MADFHIKRGDLLPAITATLKGADGNAVDLQGATVGFNMRSIKGGTPKVSATATVVQVGDGSDGSKGKVSYTWVGTDTDTAGEYQAEWEATFAGKTETFPNDKHLLILVHDDLG